MKKMKLRKWVKVTLSIILIASMVLATISLANSDKKAYEECLIENNNDVNYCHRLVEW